MHGLTTGFSGPRSAPPLNRSARRWTTMDLEHRLCTEGCELDQNLRVKIRKYRDVIRIF